MIAFASGSACKVNIYIPHWLDSMKQSRPRSNEYLPFTFHTG